MTQSRKKNGFTLLEVVLVLIVLTGVAGLAVPRVRSAVMGQQKQRFLYSVASLSSESWRQAQLDGQVMHIAFDSATAQAWWEEGGVGVSFPAGYRVSRTTLWLFGPDSPPANPAVPLYSPADTLTVFCTLSLQWVKRLK